MIQLRAVRLAAALLLLASLPAGAQEAPETDPFPLPESSARSAADRAHEKWLKEVDPLITNRERAAFLKLRTVYQRDAFIQRFWQSRDPFPETARNELRERWERNIGLARTLYGSLNDDRARVLLIHDKPTSAFQVKCTTTRKPAEVWFYDGSAQVSFKFLLIFLQKNGTGPGRVWRPDSFGMEQELSASRNCINGDRLSQAMSLVRQARSDYELALQRVLSKPKPRSEEWLSTFVSFTTDLPNDAELFEANLDISFPGRYQSRTVTQGLLRIDTSQLSFGEFAGYRSFDFQLTGEVVLEDRLFENFRYKFGFPAEGVSPEQALPLAFQRFLRPGEYSLILKLEDLNGGRFFRYEGSLAVPEVDEVIAQAPPVDPESAELFKEATAAVAEGETSIRIVTPRSDLLTGFVRFDTLAVGEDIDRVAFLLDGRRLMNKNRPPYNVEIDLGPFPRLRELRVEALDDAGTVLAEDELLINSGGNRFDVKLVEPRKGKTYTDSLLARVEVEVPEGRSLERVELFLNEALVATLYQPPYTQPVALPEQQEISYLRAVGYLPDGNSTEDVVFINAPDYLEEIDVQFVELFTTVLDRAARPVQNLDLAQFAVFEDGVEQKVSRFERVADLPIHVGVLIDNSGSMRNALNQARLAALSFFSHAITPRDRAAIITFNRLPTLAVKLTNDLQTLGSGLAGLTAEGETALYDSIMFGLYYFTGIKGQRALLLLSDGKDEASRFSFDETLEYARRAGVTIYTIGLSLANQEARGNLRRLADETGGRTFFISQAEQLEEIYIQIQEDLRSQYLLAYQSSNTSESDDFRSVEVKLDTPGHTARTISGYYP